MEKTNYSFLQGGGEMGELTRSYNWEDSAVGSPIQWPQSLRTTLGILLHSAFPMFLFWGEELICFYNDAFRPSLGQQGKHPAIGKQGKEVWPEIWEFIGPLIEKVMKTGEPVWYENRLVPFYRNGRIENIYWTFSYSPAYGNNGEINGVFVTCMETTDTVTTFQELQESKQDLAFAIEAAELARWDFNPITNQFTADARYEEWFGLKAKDATDNNLSLQIIADQDRKRVTDALAQSLIYSSGGRFDIEYVIKPQNRRERVLRAKGKAWFTEECTPYRVTGTLQDVTEQVNSRKQVEESEHLFRSLIEEAPVAAAFYTGKEITIRYANDLMIGYWGKDASVIGKTFREALPELDDQHFPKSLERVFVTGEPYVGTNEQADIIVDGKLRPFYFNFTYKPLRNKEGKIYGIHHMAIDVTKEVLAQKQVVENEKNLRNLILKAPVAICIFRGPHYIIEIANEKMFEFWGKGADEVMHKPLFEALPEAQNQGYEELLANVYITGNPFSANEQLVTLPRSGSVQKVFINFSYQPLHEANGSISGIIAVAVDVTEQVIARHGIEAVVTERTKELAEANRQLQQNNKELQQFAYIASHDLQEPIRKVTTFTQMLQKSLGTVDARSQIYFNKISSASERMLALIRDVLTFSQLSQEREKFKQVDLTEILENIKNDFELLIEEKQATINSTPLPVITAIPLQMNQLFTNLISNALKFSRKEVPPVINITATIFPKDELKNYRELNQSVDYYQIQFSDNGIGFEQQYADTIFDIFQRLHGRSEYEGTGIGLAICKKIAQNHNGYLNATSSTNNGATFDILLPKEQSAEVSQLDNISDNQQ